LRLYSKKFTNKRRLATLHEIVFIYLFNPLNLVSDGYSNLPVTNVVHTNL
jgi:hypothetical protein